MTHSYLKVSEKTKINSTATAFNISETPLFSSFETLFSTSETLFTEPGFAQTSLRHSSCIVDKNQIGWPFGRL